MADTLLTGLRAWWTMEAATDGLRADSHSVYPLTENGSLNTVSGINGNAADFAGTGYLSHADVTGLRLGGTDWTFSFWIKPYSFPGAQYLILKSPGGANTNGYALFYGPTSLGGFIGMGPNGNLNFGHGGRDFSIDEWHHILWWYDSTAGTINTQVNNGTPQSTAQAFPQVDGTHAFQIGLRGVNPILDAVVDEFALWERVLTEDERARLFGDQLTYNDLILSGASSRPVLSSPHLIGDLR